MKNSNRYYEIIGSVGVIGVCNGDWLLHAAQEDKVESFGQISKQQFDKYGDNDWVKPKSTKRWKPTIVSTLKLERIKP